MTASNPYPTTRVLADLIRAGDRGAVDHVVAAVKKAGGNVRKAALELGVSVRVIYQWRDSNTALKTALAKHGLGRGSRLGQYRAALKKEG